MQSILNRDLARAAVNKARKEKKVTVGVLASVANISQSYASGVLRGYRYKKQQDCPGKEAHWLIWLEHLDIPSHQVTSTPEQKAYRTKTLYLLEATERGGGAVGIKYGITQKCAKRRAIAADAHKPMYSHRPIVSLEFASNGLAAGFEDEIKRKFGYEAHLGEYIWGKDLAVTVDQILEMTATVQSNTVFW